VVFEQSVISIGDELSTNKYKHEEIIEYKTNSYLSLH